MMRRIPALLFCAVSLSAQAADTSPLASARASERASDSTEKVLGVGLGVGPNYLGGKHSVWRAGVMLEDNFSNGIFLSSVDGVGYRFPSAGSDFSFAASLGASGSRSESDGKDDHPNRLRGMGSVDTKAQINLFGNYNKGPYHVATELHQTLGGRRGLQIDVTGKYDIVSTSEDLVQASAGFAYANRSLMQTYFGVTPQQSADSGNAVYAPKAGVAGGAIDVSWRHAFSREWVGSLAAGVTSLRGSAGDSPLTARRTSAGVGASIGYRF